MPIIFSGNSLLLVGNSLATGTPCCCGTGTTPGTGTHNFASCPNCLSGLTGVLLVIAGFEDRSCACHTGTWSSLNGTYVLDLSSSKIISDVCGLGSSTYQYWYCSTSKEITISNGVTYTVTMLGVALVCVELNTKICGRVIFTGTTSGTNDGCSYFCNELPLFWTNSGVGLTRRPWAEFCNDGYPISGSILQPDNSTKPDCCTDITYYGAQTSTYDAYALA